MSAGPSSPRRPTALDERATQAERAVSGLFAGRLLGMPGTHLTRAVQSRPGSPRALRALSGWGGPWNYWWQAHYLDAVVDAGLRALGCGDIPAAEQHVRRGDRLLATVRLRNGLRWTNAYYDDMAWLALASGRLEELHDRVGRLEELHDRVGRRYRLRRLQSADRHLTAQLRSAHTSDLGGGLFWNRDRDFKNAPATGPAALHLARLGATGEARRLVDWLHARLSSPQSGLVRDGIRLPRGAGGEELLVPDVWTYNQGTVLGALVTLGDPESLARAAALVAAVDAHLTVEVGGARVLRTHGGGDGGLFTGILVRYLALAAGPDSRLEEPARTTARRLVVDTAEALWATRAGLPLGRHGSVPVFPLEPGAAAPRPPLELSPQLQAWTVLEAAATLG